jgi:hypothetical protein
LAVEKALEAEKTPPEPPGAAPEGRKAREGELGLGRSGRKLYEAVTEASKRLSPLQVPLLLEACRIVDRLDQLDIQLHGGDWLRFRARNDDGTEVLVVVDRLLTEAREQATALKGLVAELVKTGIVEKPTSTAKSGGGGIVDLAALIAARRASPAG